MEVGRKGEGILDQNVSLEATFAIITNEETQ